MTIVIVATLSDLCVKGMILTIHSVYHLSEFGLRYLLQCPVQRDDPAILQKGMMLSK